MFKEIVRKCKLILENLPGIKRFGIYGLLPYSFAGGAALEYVMIHWRPGGHNFYDTYMRKEATRVAIEQLKILGELDPGVEDI